MILKVTSSNVVTSIDVSINIKFENKEEINRFLDDLGSSIHWMEVDNVMLNVAGETPKLMSVLINLAQAIRSKT